MTRGRKRVHMPSSKPNQALCTWTFVECDSDVSRVTCRACLRAYATAFGVKMPRKGGALTGDRAALVEALRATLAPMADATPVITPQLWAISCKGAEHRRCGDCAFCVWERDAERWAFASPWNRQLHLVRPETRPRWPSLAAAFVALVEFEAHDRAMPSALGGIIDRMRRGASSGQSDSARPDDPLLRRAGELVRVRQALEQAFPEGVHALPAVHCRALLVIRTPGVLTKMPSYEALTEQLPVTASVLRALVRAGRAAVEGDLAERGLIPRPRARPRSLPSSHAHAHYEATG